MGPSWAQVGPKLAAESTLERSYGRFGWGPGLQDKFLIDFDANMEPSWVQVGAKLASKSHPYRHDVSKIVLVWILEPLGLVFGQLLGSKMKVKNELKIRGVETAKFDSRIDGSSIFDVPMG